MNLDVPAFVKAVKDRPPLWMSRHPQRHERHSIWKEVGRIFPHLRVEDLKKKWKNLKDTYRREAKKNPDPLFVQWPHFQYLDFLKDELNLNPKSEHDDSHIEFEFQPETFTEDFDEELQTEDVKPQIVRQTFSPQESPSNSPQQATSSNTNRKRANPTDLRGEYLEMKKKLKCLEQEVSMSEEPNQDATKSTDYYFLMSILPEMEKLSPIQKLRFRNKINQALMEEMKTNNDD